MAHWSPRRNKRCYREDSRFIKITRPNNPINMKIRICNCYCHQITGSGKACIACPEENEVEIDTDSFRGIIGSEDISTPKSS